MPHSLSLQTRLPRTASLAGVAAHFAAKKLGAKATHCRSLAPIHVRALIRKDCPSEHTASPERASTLKLGHREQNHIRYRAATSSIVTAVAGQITITDKEKPTLQMANVRAFGQTISSTPRMGRTLFAPPLRCPAHLAVYVAPSSSPAPKRASATQPAASVFALKQRPRSTLASLCPPTAR
jgi:hypothetical protein